MRRVLVMIAVSFAAGSAHAQAPVGGSNTLAEQLFNQARDLAKANQWAEACPKFEASLRYDPVLGTRLNLATCYEHVGKLASAWGLYRESIDLAKKANDPKRAAYAQKQAAALEPRLPKLAISAPANPPAGFVVKRDDTTVDPGALGVGLYVDPGPHKVVASAPGFVEATLSVTLTEGKTEALTIPDLVAKPDAPPVAETRPVAQPIDDGEPGPRSKTRMYAALGVGGAGVAAVAVGLVFGVKARGSYNDAKALCGDDMVCPAANLAQDQKLVSDARSSATISTVLVIGGGAAIAAGVILYLTAPRSHERATARLVPVAHDGGAGLALTGAF